MTDLGLYVRAALAADLPFIQRMLHEAANRPGEDAPRPRARRMVRPLCETVRTFGTWPVARAISLSRSDRLNMPELLSGLLTAATTRASNIAAALSITSRWPR